MEFRASYLRCEYLADPLGIDECEPRLSWIVESGSRNQEQTAYRILVASSPQLLAKNKGDLWDSGRIHSDETTSVVYQGKALKSRMRCCWKVKVWDKDGRASAWSPSAQWSMGLLRGSDWRAKWIGFDKPRKDLADPEKYPVLPPARYLQKHFELNKPIARATLYGTSLGIHVLFLNGCRVAQEYFNPGWTDYNKRIYYRTYDVTSLVRRGDNAMGAILADGWYSGYIGPYRKRDQYGADLRLRAQLEVEFEDGSSAMLGTDGTWRASTGPIVTSDFLMGERYDARKELPQWAEPGSDLSNWSPVDIGSERKAKLQAAPHPAIQVFAERRPKSISEPRPGLYVLDMGTNFAGFVRLKVKGKRGTVVRLRFGERLQKDGAVYTRNLGIARATDTYVCKGEGQELCEPLFAYHGFQYVQVTGYPGKLTRGSVTGIELSSATPVVGDFACSSSMVNQLYRNICQTQRSNFMDIPTDCPQRDERLGWTGDAQMYIRTAVSNNDVQAFFKKWLVDLADAQRADGQYPRVAPLKVSTDDGGPAWSDAGVICPWTIYEVYGDERILATHYAGMKRFVEFCRKRSTAELLPPETFHCIGDWLDLDGNTSRHVVYSAYFACSTRLLARIAAVLGKRTDAAHYEKLFQRIKKAFNKAYVDGDGRIVGDTQATYALAIQYELLDDQLQQKAAMHLVEAIKRRDWHLSTGFVGTKDLMPALSKVGRTDVAYRLLHNTTFPSWGFLIQQGATSIWERWDGWRPEKGFQTISGNSFAHYAYGAVYQWMVETVGGIRTDGPGFKRIIVRPEPGGRLTRAKTSYNSIRGLIATAWKRTGKELVLDVTIPANTTAEVHVPAKDLSHVTEGGQPAHKAEGVKFLHMEDRSAVFHVGSGCYRFVSGRFK